jgi:hypothetical protein
VPPALLDLTLHGDTDIEKYLALDDISLWHALTAWRGCKDVVLADLCQRLHSRRLFKTLRLYGADQSADAYGEARELACELVRERGLDPDVYVGLDRAVLVPFDEAKDGLRVIFPNGSSHAPGDVSFVLGRLRGQRLERIRLLFPPEVRDELLRRLGRLGDALA